MHEPPEELIALDKEDLAAMARILSRIPLLASSSAADTTPPEVTKKQTKQRA
jgi:hypothetical protein